MGGGIASSSDSEGGEGGAGAWELLVLQKAKKLELLEGKKKDGRDVPHFVAVCFAVYHLVDFLVSKQLQDQGEIIRVEEKLGEVFELQDIFILSDFTLSDE
jgi:hypothetical protein